MNDIRAKFEEIWPVPEQIEWDDKFGQYLGDHELQLEFNARLDTFTRCQETTDVYVSLVDELVAVLDNYWAELPDCLNSKIACALAAHANQIMEQKK